MEGYTAYKPDTGEITNHIFGDPISLALNKPKHAVEGIYDPNTDYISPSSKQPTKRPFQKTLLKESQLINLPIPCVIYINNVPYACNESEAEISFDQPGSYKILVEAFPYLDKEFVHENHA